MATSSFFPAAGAEPIPGYRLLELLGQGGFGQVWKATAPGGFLVALKFVGLNEGASPAEERALEVIRQVRHPNLVVTFGAWQIPGYLLIAMELADRTLFDRFQEAVAQGLSGIPRDELLEYIREAAKGIDYLNQPWTGSDGRVRPAVQHRDIKPKNILLVGSGVKVADFGLARFMQRAVVSQAGHLTPSYAAPEFFKHEMASQSDQYSLAVTYCQLRGGRLPFTGDLMQLMLGHMGQPPDLSMLPEAERPAVARALAKDPAQRWPSCRAFVEALQAAAIASTDTGPAPRKPAGFVPDQTTRASVAVPPSNGSTVEPGTLHAGEPLSRQTAEVARPPAPKPGQAPIPPWKPLPSRRPRVWPWASLGALAVGAVAAGWLWSRRPPERVPSLPAPVVAAPDALPQQAATSLPRPGPGRGDPPRRTAPAVAKADAPVKPRPQPIAPPLAEKEFTNSIGMRLVRIPPGAFLMGSPEEDRDAGSDEKPRHPVEITRAFYLGKDEVTRGQFRTFVEDTGYRSEAERDGLGGSGYDAASGQFKGPRYNPDTRKMEGPPTSYTWRDCGFQQTDEHPVVNVSWNDAQAFCAWLGQKEGRPYRLPTEAEWEYACRAGTTTRFYSGDDPRSLAKAGNVADASLRRMFKGTAVEADDGYVFTAPVGKFAANAFGLYDMHGNVWEWCRDGYDPDSYQKSPRQDPPGPAAAACRVIRGGSWYAEPAYCRSACRDRNVPTGRDAYLGFRVLCLPEAAR